MKFRLAAPVLAAALLAACNGPGGGSAGPGRQGKTTCAPATPAVSGTTPVPGPSARGITVRSTAFAEGARIPARYSCHGGNTPPPLTWSGIPAGAASIALVMDDPDAPGGTYTHWVVFNLPVSADGIAGGQLPAGAAQALNSGRQAAYLGPCPPSGTHHYRFTVYAEKRKLDLREGAPLPEALTAIKANSIVAGRLTGLFSA